MIVCLAISGYPLSLQCYENFFYIFAYFIILEYSQKLYQGEKMSIEIGRFDKFIRGRQRRNIKMLS